MSATIDAFLKKYKLADSNISSYDNDTIQMITEILNGNMQINYFIKKSFENKGIFNYFINKSIENINICKIKYL